MLLIIELNSIWIMKYITDESLSVCESVTSGSLFLISKIR